jgi:hypothetical protein
MGDWLQQNVSRTAIASYVGAILIDEGYATKGEKRRQATFFKILVVASAKNSLNITHPNFWSFQ